MKLALPTRKDGKYIRQKLEAFYLANQHEFTPEHEKKELDRALQRLFCFFKLPIPKVAWFKHLGGFNPSRTLGQCTYEGTINLLTPFYHKDGGFEGWLDTFYHEIGHYVLWYDEERKAREFAKKLRERR